MNSMIDKGYIFTAKDNDGNDIECEVVMSFIANNGKAYLFYTDNTLDNENNLNLYASRFLGEDNGQLELEEITDDNEWSLLDDALLKAQEGLNG